MVLPQYFVIISLLLYTIAYTYHINQHMWTEYTSNTHTQTHTGYKVRLQTTVACLSHKYIDTVLLITSYNIPGVPIIKQKLLNKIYIKFVSKFYIFEFIE